VEVETQLLDDFCGCFDVWHQQPINLLFLLQLCHSYVTVRFFSFHVVVLIWGRTNKDVLIVDYRNDMIQHKMLIIWKHTILYAICSEKIIAY
jgi:hypothetical protein